MSRSSVPLRRGVTCARARRDQTLASLDSLHSQDAHVAIHVFLVDDGSFDGTAAAVVAAHENVRVIRGDGNLFWAAAMARAEEEALATDASFLMWFNDDVILDPGCLSAMLGVLDTNPEAIVVGAMRDPATGALTYGGRRRMGAHPQKFSAMSISAGVRECDTFHGNCVIVPRGASHRIGPIDSVFPHAYADDDYGMRGRPTTGPTSASPGAWPAAAPAWPR